MATSSEITTKTLAELQQKLLEHPSAETSKSIRNLADKYCSSRSGLISDAHYIWLAYQKDDTKPHGIQMFLMAETEDDISNVRFKPREETVNICVYKLNRISDNQQLQNEQMKADELSNLDLITMRNSINKLANDLFANHKHLTIIEPSGIRLKDSKYKGEKCIALYVRKKGFIPMGETLFENTIGDFQVDVREGIVYQAMQNEGTQTLKMGCKIARLEYPQQSVAKCGTLGGFIDHPEYGICGLTAAHVLLTDTEMYELMGTGELTWLQIPSLVEVYFCDENNINRKLGHFVKAVYEKGTIGKSGFEVAIFQIGTFFKTSGELRVAGHRADDVQDFFNTGKVFSPINCSQDSLFLKYGAFSGKTTGTFFNRLPVDTVRLAARSDPGLYTIELWNQISIRSTEERPFGVLGDSGSLVMVPGEHCETLCVGIFEGISLDDSKTFVSPIGPVLEKLNVSSFKCFQQNELLATVRAFGQRLDQLEQNTDQILHAVNRLNVQNIPYARYCNIL